MGEGALSRALDVHPREVIALVGGGGKTTLMFRLAAELVAAGWRVVTTTSTRLAAFETAAAPQCLVDEDERSLIERLPAALERSRHVLVLREVIQAVDLARGLARAAIERIAALPAVDCLIVEADGAHERPFKAPAAHEPVIPVCATLVVPIAGMDVVGRPLCEEFVHRPRVVARLVDVRLRTAVTPALVAAVLGHEQGGAKSAPPSARLVPFLNKADTTGILRSALAVARPLLERPRIERVVIGAVGTPMAVRAVCQRSGPAVCDGSDGFACVSPAETEVDVERSVVWPY